MRQGIVHGQMNKIKVAMNVRLWAKADIGQPLGAMRPMASHWKLAGAATTGLTGLSFGFSTLQMM
jgi:hypothetical protein